MLHIREAQAALERALSTDISDHALITSITETLKLAYINEEQFWRQWSRVLWLQSGDRNTWFFQATTRGRRAANLLYVLEDDEGTVYYEEEQIANLITRYYQELFASNQNENFQIVQDVLQPRISTVVNEKLISIPDDHEIHEAVFSIHGDKALGPDGFSATFYHSFWDLLDRM